MFRMAKTWVGKAPSEAVPDSARFLAFKTERMQQPARAVVQAPAVLPSAVAPPAAPACHHPEETYLGLLGSTAVKIMGEHAATQPIGSLPREAALVVPPSATEAIGNPPDNQYGSMLHSCTPDRLSAAATLMRFIPKPSPPPREPDNLPGPGARRQLLFPLISPPFRRRTRTATPSPEHHAADTPPALEAALALPPPPSASPPSLPPSPPEGDGSSPSPTPRRITAILLSPLRRRAQPVSAYRSRSPKASATASALPSAATPSRPSSVQYEPESAEYHRAVSDGALGALTARAEDEMEMRTALQVAADLDCAALPSPSPPPSPPQPFTTPPVLDAADILKERCRHLEAAGILLEAAVSQLKAAPESPFTPIRPSFAARMELSEDTLVLVSPVDTASAQMYDELCTLAAREPQLVHLASERCAAGVKHSALDGSPISLSDKERNALERTACSRPSPPLVQRQPAFMLPPSPYPDPSPLPSPPPTAPAHRARLRWCFSHRKWNKLVVCMARFETRDTPCVCDSDSMRVVSAFPTACAARKYFTHALAPPLPLDASRLEQDDGRARGSKRALPRAASPPNPLCSALRARSTPWLATLRGVRPPRCGLRGFCAMWHAAAAVRISRTTFSTPSKGSSTVSSQEGQQLCLWRIRMASSSLRPKPRTDGSVPPMCFRGWCCSCAVARCVR